MPSTSVSTMLLFIGAISAATVATGTIVTGASEVGNAVRQQGVDAAREVDTEIRIVNDPEADMVDGSEVRILVKNTGDAELVARNDTIDLVIDGAFVQDRYEKVELPASSDDQWDPGGVAIVFVDPTPLPASSYDTGSESHRVKVVVGDNSDGFSYD